MSHSLPPCHHREPVHAGVSMCELMPHAVNSDAVCARCVRTCWRHGRPPDSPAAVAPLLDAAPPSPRHSPPPAHHPPTAAGMLARFGRAMARWLRAGLPVVDRETYASRLEICQACEHFRPGWLGARCTGCGCHEVKLHLATEQCPLDTPKWEKIRNPKHEIRNKSE